MCLSWKPPLINAIISKARTPKTDWPQKDTLMPKKKKEVTIHSSAAEYLTFIAATGDNKQSFEMRYEDENIWLTQKMMATLYDVSVAAINQHISRIFDDHELDHGAVVKKYLITATDGKNGCRPRRQNPAQRCRCGKKLFVWRRNAIAHVDCLGLP